MAKYGQVGLDRFEWACTITFEVACIADKANIQAYRRQASALAEMRERVLVGIAGAIVALRRVTNDAANRRKEDEEVKFLWLLQVRVEVQVLMEIPGALDLVA